jgi:hypothetical protein
MQVQVVQEPRKKLEKLCGSLKKSVGHRTEEVWKFIDADEPRKIQSNMFRLQTCKIKVKIKWNASEYGFKLFGHVCVFCSDVKFGLWL